MSTTTTTTGPPPRTTRMRNRAILLKFLPVIPFVLLLLAWIVGWQVVRPTPATLPQVSTVLSTYADMAASGALLVDVLASLQRLVLGAVTGMVSGIVFGVVTGLNRRLAASVNPVVTFFSGISGIVWVPLAIAWLGIGNGMVIFIIWNAVFFLVFGNTLLGVQLVPVVLENGARTLGASKMQVIRQVTLPGAAPNIMSGIRSGLGFGWRALIAAEIIGATTGLGQLIFKAAEFRRSDIILGGSIIIGIIGMSMDRFLLAPLERRTVERWGLVSTADTAGG